MGTYCVSMNLLCSSIDADVLARFGSFWNAMVQEEWKLLEFPGYQAPTGATPDVGFVAALNSTVLTKFRAEIADDLGINQGDIVTLNSLSAWSSPTSTTAPHEGGPAVIGAVVVQNAVATSAPWLIAGPISKHISEVQVRVFWRFYNV